MGTSSNGRYSHKSLHNASPLTYLMKDTKVVDSDKIREPVLRQKYQRASRIGGYTKKTVNPGGPVGSGGRLNETKSTVGHPNGHSLRRNRSLKGHNKRQS